jgi:hypothetical protein
VVGLQALLSGILLLLGVGFLAANAQLLLEYRRFLARRRGALLVWPGPRPERDAAGLALGVVLGLLICYKLLVVHRQAFGEIMMFLYYAYMVPLSRRIGRGFYEDGIWSDTDFIRYQEVGGISWREGEQQVTLVVISRLRSLARRLTVPGESYGAARRLLRDKIGEHVIRLDAPGLDLGGRDDRDEV